MLVERVRLSIRTEDGLLGTAPCNKVVLATGRPIGRVALNTKRRVRLSVLFAGVVTCGRFLEKNNVVTQ